MFSLILCTINRVDDVENFLLSLLPNSMNIEIILVDQNERPVLDDIVSKYRTSLNINHIKTSLRGLSKARNLGLKYVHGDFIAFPDDDCLYSPNLLNKIKNEFDSNKLLDFISIKTEDLNNKNRSLVTCSTERHPISMNRIVGCSFTYFFKRNDIFLKLKFSENMGVGANTPYGSGEETDFIANMLYLGASGVYIPDIIVYHPAKELLYNKDTLNRMKLYGGGYGYYIRKNFKILGMSNLLRLLLAPIIRVIFRSRSRKDLTKSLYFLNGFFIGLFK